MSCSSGRVGVGYEGDTCSFTCNTGYELAGSDTRTCQSNGNWSGSDDVCVKGKHIQHYSHQLNCKLVHNLRIASSMILFIHDDRYIRLIKN